MRRPTDLCPLRAFVWVLTASCGAGGVDVLGIDSLARDRETVDSAELHLSGTLQVRIHDGPDESSSEYVLVTPDGERILLAMPEQSGLRSGLEVAVVARHRNRSKGGALQVTSVTPVKARAKRPDGPLTRTRVHHRVAILATQSADVSQQRAFAAMKAARDYFAEVSDGIDTFEPTVFRRYDVGYSSSDCQYDNSRRVADRLIDRFEADGFDASDYEHIAAIVPRSCGSDWSGAWAYVGGFDEDGRPDFSQLSMYKDNVVDPWYFAHEIGHNLGLNHANSLDCGGATYRKNGSDCDMTKYGNHNDVMGWGEAVHFSMPYKRFMGWVGATYVVTARGDDVYNLTAADAQSCGIRAVRIPVPGESDAYFYVEYRKSNPQSDYAGTGEVGGSRRDVVLVTHAEDDTGDSSSSYTYRIELGTSRYDGARIGRRYDFGSGVYVTVLGTNGEYAEVRVEMNGDGTPRDDSGAAASVQGDGTLGVRTCEAPSAECVGHELASRGVLMRRELICNSDESTRFGILGGDVVFERDGKAVWRADQSGGLRLTMQGDGNLVLRDDADRPLWSSRSAGNDGASLTVENAGRSIVIRGTDGCSLWHVGEEPASCEAPGGGHGACIAEGLAPGDRLDSDEAICSADGVSRFGIVDGDLVFAQGGATIWRAERSAATGLFMQNDGNLVLRDLARAPLWSSRTASHPGAFVAVENDGRSVVLRGGDGCRLWHVGAEPVACE